MLTSLFEQLQLNPVEKEEKAFKTDTDTDGKPNWQACAETTGNVKGREYETDNTVQSWAVLRGNIDANGPRIRYELS